MDNQPLSPEPPSEIVPEATHQSTDLPSDDLSSDLTTGDGSVTLDHDGKDHDGTGETAMVMDQSSNHDDDQDDNQSDDDNNPNNSGDDPYDVPPPSPVISQVGLWWRWFLATLFGALLGTIAGIPACLAGLYWWSNLLTDRNLCHVVLLGGTSHLSCSIATAMVSGSVMVGLWLGICQSWVLPWLMGHRIFPRQYIPRYGTPYGDVPLSTEVCQPYPQDRPYRRWWVLASVVGWTCIGLTATSLAYLPVLTAIIAPEGPSIDPSISQQLPSLTTGWGWFTGSGILLGMLQWLVMVFATWRVGMPWRLSLRQGLRRGVLWRSAWWVFLHGVLFGLTGLAIIAIFRGRGGLFALLIFFLSFMPFYAGITGANLVKLKLKPQAKRRFK